MIGWMDSDQDQPAQSAMSIWPDQTATVQPPRLAVESNILDLVAAEVAAAGVAGESRVVQLLYLVVTTRLLDRPCSIALKGPSGGGKSFLVGQMLELFPPSAYYALSAMSDRALAYDTEPLVHRMLVIYEAAGIRSDMASYLMRSLLSEGRINYVTVERGKSSLTPRRIDRAGPTGLITTTTAVSLHPENETRLMSVTLADTPEQTRAVMLAQARGGRTSRDLRPWHDLQTWLADQPTDVEIPFAETLAKAIPPVAVRLRRDFAMLLALISGHALLHQLLRERNDDDALVATFEDYAVVRELVWDVMADAAERAVPAIVRETVAAVGALTQDDPLDEGVTYTHVASFLRLDKATAMRRSRMAISRGFVRNLEPRPGRPARLIIGDPLPEDGSLLPSASELALLHGCALDDGDQDEELDYPRALTTGVDDPAGEPADWTLAPVAHQDEPAR
jgi:hypothetical protein